MTRDDGGDRATYSLRRLERTLGVSRGVVAGLVAAGFVTPGRGPRNELRFSFQDVVLLRTAHGLQSARIPKRKILQSLTRLRAQLPAALPLSGLRITAIGNDVVVHDGGTRWAADTGQLIMDFDVASVAGGVAILPHAHALRAALAAGPDSDANGDADVGADTGSKADTTGRADAGGKADANASANANANAGAGAGASAAAWFARGRALDPTDPARAEAAYRRALTLAPDHLDACLNLGALLCETERCSEAVLLFDGAMARFPDHAALHFNRAIALEDAGRLLDALDAYERALALDPDLADAHFNAARLHEQQGDAQRALRHYNAYRRLSPP